MDRIECDVQSRPRGHARLDQDTMTPDQANWEDYETTLSSSDDSSSDSYSNAGSAIRSRRRTVSSIGENNKPQLNAPDLTTASTVQVDALPTQQLPRPPLPPLQRTNNVNINNNGASNLGPWLLVVVYALIQVLFSSSGGPSNGVNASTSNTKVFNHSQGTMPSKVLTNERRLALRDQAKEMFFHGFNGYMEFAFPMDELNPITCRGQGPDKTDPNNVNINDVLGDFSLTLIDSLDTLAAMGEHDRFREAIKLIKKHVSFQLNSRVQVFEVNIRVMGALLSGHLYATDPRLKSVVPGYKGELLDLARDLGIRLLPAFQNTKTGIPWARVHLTKGVLKNESTETCVAGAGSLLLEFGVLSRLTGDRRFEDAAAIALNKLWKTRSALGLVPNTIDIRTGFATNKMTGIGAGTDSFYEYLLKSYVLFGEDQYLEMYDSSVEAIKKNLLHGSRYFYKHVHLEDGVTLANWIDSLSAFMPGVQVLGGDLESAIKNHLYYYNIWRKYQAIPERFNFVTQDIDIVNYPLRPEFVESTYLLYRATKDPFYLAVGEMILGDLQKYTRTRCGFASVQNVTTKKLEDRMESFALSETLKYLFLLFDEENVLHTLDSNYVFTTEGHVLQLSAQYLDSKLVGSEFTTSSSEKSSKKKNKKNVAMQRSTTTAPKTKFDPAWRTCKRHETPNTFLKGLAYRTDIDYARHLVGTYADARDRVELDPAGFCERPTYEIQRVVVEFYPPDRQTFHDEADDEEDQVGTANIKGASWRTKPASMAAAAPVIRKWSTGVFMNQLIGVKMKLEFDPIMKGYNAIQVNQVPVPPETSVFVSEKSMQPLLDQYQQHQPAHLRILRSVVVENTGTPGASATTAASDAKSSSSDSNSNSSSKQIRIVEEYIPLLPAVFGHWRPSLRHIENDRYVKEGRDFGPNAFTADRPSFPASSEPDQTRFSDSNYSNNGHGSNNNNDALLPTKSSLGGLQALELAFLEDNQRGCRPFTSSQQSQIRNKILVLHRGDCVFALKTFYAQHAGAAALVIVNTENEIFRMSGSYHPSKDLGGGGGSPPAPGQKIKSGVLGDHINDDWLLIETVMIGRDNGAVLIDWIRKTQPPTPKKQEQQHKGWLSTPTATTVAPPTSTLVSANERDNYLRAGFVQKRLTAAEKETAQLSYESFPILNIVTLGK